MQGDADLSYVPYSEDAPLAGGKKPKKAKGAKSPKTPKDSSAKKISTPVIVLIILTVVALILGGVVFYLFKTGFFAPESPAEISDAQFLASQKSWEMRTAPTVIWTFNPDGTGELTTNKKNYYKTTWTLQDGKLNIKTAWLYELDDTFEFSLNRDQNSFYVLNLSSNNESTFVPLGTSAQTTPAETE